MSGSRWQDRAVLRVSVSNWSTDTADVDAVGTLGLQPDRLKAMGQSAVAAARRVRWDDVLGRFEAELQDTVDGHQAQLSAAPVVA